MSDSIVLRIRFDGDVDETLWTTDGAQTAAASFAEQLSEVLLTTGESGGAWGWGDANVIAVEPYEPDLATELRDA